MSKYCYKYPRPALTTDIIIFAPDTNNNLHVLLIERKHEPYANTWALPGGFVDMDETVEECAKRELYEETGVKDILLEQLIVMSDPKRDPRGRTVSVVFWHLASHFLLLKANDDAKNAAWFPIGNLPPLAFDHKEILLIAFKKLLSILEHNPLSVNFISPELNISSLKAFIKELKNVFYKNI